MGAPYTVLDQVYNFDHDIEKDIVVEIGSENGEGSSRWLHRWASQRGMAFYSVDIDAGTRARDYPEINWVVASSGSQWCQTVLPGLNKTIKVLYLDNFDYMYDTDHPTVTEHYRQQVSAYAQRGVTMNNQNSMEEHRLQVKYCLPYMAKESIIVMDDTYYDSQLKTQPPEELKCWYGKCATAMPLMIEAGYEIIRHEENGIAYAIRTR